MMRVLAALVLYFASAQCSLPPSHLDFGNYTMQITTTSVLAQRLFDEGLVHAFGFNMHEAQRAFTKCAAADPTAPMCSWGLANAHGPFLNYVPITAADAAAGSQAARAAVGKAESVAVSPKEAALVAAMPTRFPPAGGNQSRAFEAYAAAMRAVVREFPLDADVLALSASAEMELCKLYYRGYFVHETMDAPTGGWVPQAVQAKALLERALRNATNTHHPLVLHLYVHLTEPGRPGQGGAGLGEAAADALAKLDYRGSGHLEHMPGHLYLRVGRYQDAINANIKAHTADVDYMDRQMTPYGPAHNEAFGSYAAAMDGQSAASVRAAEAMRALYEAGSEVYDGAPSMEIGWNLVLAQHARFAHWPAVLADSSIVPNSTAWPYAAVLRHYARGLAQAAQGHRSGFAEEWGLLQAALRRVRPSPSSRTDSLGAVANATLAARSLVMAGDLSAAAKLLEGAAMAQLGWEYFEPPNWHYPVRQCWGAVLLKAGRAAAAEAVFRADLQQYMRNGWSLLGLVQAMAHQPDKYSRPQVAEVRAAFDKAWARADERISSACPMFFDS